MAETINLLTQVFVFDDVEIKFVFVSRLYLLTNPELVRYYRELKKHEFRGFLEPASRDALLSIYPPAHPPHIAGLWRWMADNWKSIDKDIHRYIHIPKPSVTLVKKLVGEVGETAKQLKRNMEEHPTIAIHLLGLINMPYQGDTILYPIHLGMKKWVYNEEIKVETALRVVEEVGGYPVAVLWTDSIFSGMFLLHTPKHGCVAGREIERRGSTYSTTTIYGLYGLNLEHPLDPLPEFLKREMLGSLSPHTSFTRYVEGLEELEEMEECC